MKILILTCSTGEGHNSAARALAERLESSGHEVKICDPLDFKSESAARKAANAYNGTIKHAPLLFGITYAAGLIYDFTGLPSPVYRSNAACAEKLAEYIKEENFGRIICTHLFAMMSVTAVKRKCGINVPAYGVLTDYTAIPFYRETELDGYFVPTEEVKAQLVRKKIPREKIFVTGIPVRPEFSAPLSVKEARAKLGLPADKKIIALTSGGVGCGKILKICNKLKKCAGDCEIFVFTGKNEKLKKKIDDKFGGQIRAEGFTDKIYAYLKSADVVLSKAGGLSSTEAAVLNVPLVHLKSIPGCETANRRYFSKNGLSVYAGSARKAARSACELLRNGQRAEAMRKKQREHINPFAAKEIIGGVIN